MRPVLFALAAFAIGGCTPLQWVRDGAVPAPEAVEKDSADCRQAAWREAQYRNWGYGAPFGPIYGRDPFGRRFVTSPYGWGYPFFDPFFEESRLADFCMRSKGYQLVPIEKKAEPTQKPPA